MPQSCLKKFTGFDYLNHACLDYLKAVEVLTLDCQKQKMGAHALLRLEFAIESYFTAENRLEKSLSFYPYHYRIDG